MVRILVIVICVALGLTASAEDPNIIVIYVDDMGYGDVSGLNSDARLKTENVDRLMAEGMTFLDGHSPASVCTPSRYGLLTGRYAWRTRLKRGVLRAEAPCLIEDGRVTLGSLLREHGYRTGMVGKWHLGMDFPGTWGDRDWSQPTRDMPLDKGFDYFWGIPASMNYGVLAWFDGRFPITAPTQYTRKKPNESAINDYRIMPPYDEHPRDEKDLEVAPDFRDVDCVSRFTTKAIEWMGGLDDSSPFFLYLSYTSPHKPVVAPEKYHGLSDAGLYGDFVMETDAEIGRVLNWLEETGQTENTMVVFTSDNGPENTWKEREKRYGHASNGEFRDGKRSIYEGGHRVPIIVRWPARVKSGIRSSDLVCQTDFIATFAEMLGHTLGDDAGEDSDSFYRVLTGASTVASRVPMIHHSMNGRFAIREGNWKLVMEHESEARELYDLERDPKEREDVLELHPEIARNLAERITRIVLDGRSTPGNVQANDTEPWGDLEWIEE